MSQTYSETHVRDEREPQTLTITVSWDGRLALGQIPGIQVRPVLNLLAAVELLAAGASAVAIAEGGNTLVETAKNLLGLVNWMKTPRTEEPPAVRDVGIMEAIEALTRVGCTIVFVAHPSGADAHIGRGDHVRIERAIRLTSADLRALAGPAEPRASGRAWAHWYRRWEIGPGDGPNAVAGALVIEGRPIFEVRAPDAAVREKLSFGAFGNDLEYLIEYRISRPDKVEQAEVSAVLDVRPRRHA